MTEKLLNKHFHLVSPCDLDLWPSYPKIYTAILQVIIYQLAKYDKDPMNNDREIGWRRWWERRKIKSKKEKTLQQQKGLPTLSADLNERALAGNSNIKYQCKSNCTIIKHIKDGHQVRKCTGRGGGWCLGFESPFFFFFFFFFFSF